MDDANADSNNPNSYEHPGSQTLHIQSNQSHSSAHLEDGKVIREPVDPFDLAKCNPYEYASPVRLDRMRRLLRSRGVHPVLMKLHRLIDETFEITRKNVEMLEEIEYVCHSLNGLRVTFCKSGKDRTGMSVSLSNARTMDNYFRGGNVPEEKILRETAVMRKHGVRIRIIEKNVGATAFAINSFQAQFLPLLYRPPPEVLSQILDSKNES